MTNEEAISTIECSLSGGCHQVCNAKYRGDCNDNDVIQAVNIAIKALEKEYKYRWHYLRKNPDDLPVNEHEFTTGYIVKQYDVVEPYSAYWDGCVWHDDDCNILINIIAWREIEPYEENE